MFRMTDERLPPACRNQILAALSGPVLASLRPHLVRHQFDQGAPLNQVEGHADAVHFPETAVFCVRASVPTGKQQGLGLIGREGAINWGLLAGVPTPACQEMTAIAGGTTLAIEARMLRMVCAADPLLSERLIGFAFRFACQLGSTLRSSMGDPIDVRLSRWLLLWHDRVDDGELVLTHDLLAGLLAVRRATVTDALHVLEGERLITATRGRIVVRSRSLLEAHAGMAYGMADRVGLETAGADGAA